jgi:hypothetical protein
VIPCTGIGGIDRKRSLKALYRHIRMLEAICGDRPAVPRSRMVRQDPDDLIETPDRSLVLVKHEMEFAFEKPCLGMIGFDRRHCIEADGGFIELFYQDKGRALLKPRPGKIRAEADDAIEALECFFMAHEAIQGPPFRIPRSGIFRALFNHLFAADECFGVLFPMIKYPAPVSPGFGEIGIDLEGSIETGCRLVTPVEAAQNLSTAAPRRCRIRFYPECAVVALERVRMPAFAGECETFAYPLVGTLPGEEHSYWKILS